MAPASAATSSASGNGKKASEASDAPFARSPAFRVAIHDESTRDICPAPIPTVAPSRTSTMVLDFTRQAIVQARSRSRHSSSVGSREETTSKSSRRSVDDVTVLHERSSRHRPHVQAARLRQRRLEHPEVLALTERRERLRLVPRRDHDLGEDVSHRLRGGPGARRVERDDPAEGRDRVALERAPVRLVRLGGNRHPARVVVLHDHAGARREGRDQRIGRVRIEPVVERHVLALEDASAPERSASGSRLHASR